MYGDTKELSVVNVGKFLIVFMINSLYRGINFRGCISYGRIIQTKNSVLGPAIDEVAEYYNLQQWIGISASPSVYNILDKTDSSKFDLYGNKIYVKYDIPLKTCIEKSGWAINWPAYELMVKKPSTKTDYFHNLIKDNLKKARTISITLKWRNTLDFFTFCKK